MEKGVQTSKLEAQFSGNQGQHQRLRYATNDLIPPESSGVCRSLTPHPAFGHPLPTNGRGSYRISPNCEMGRWLVGCDRRWRFLGWCYTAVIVLPKRNRLKALLPQGLKMRHVAYCPVGATGGLVFSSAGLVHSPHFQLVNAYSFCRFRWITVSARLEVPFTFTFRHNL